MKRYEVKRRVVNLRDVYEVRETTTNQIIDTFTAENREFAYELARLLQQGAGFDGHTPAFFIENTNSQANAEVKQIRTQDVVD